MEINNELDILKKQYSTATEKLREYKKYKDLRNSTYGVAMNELFVKLKQSIHDLFDKPSEILSREEYIYYKAKLDVVNTFLAMLNSDYEKSAEGKEKEIELTKEKIALAENINKENNG